MKGREMIFMVGVGWERNGGWHYRQFVAASETPDAERAMFAEFLEFLDHAGAFKPNGDAVLYHWSGAEIWQSAKAAERLGTPRLAVLPWRDLQKPFHAGPIALPGCWSFGLRPVAKAQGEEAGELPGEYEDGLCFALVPPGVPSRLTTFGIDC